MTLPTAEQKRQLRNRDQLLVSQLLATEAGEALLRWFKVEFELEKQGAMASDRELVLWKATWDVFSKLLWLRDKPPEPLP